MPISNQIFEHFRKPEREKQEWIKRLRQEGYIVIKKTEQYGQKKEIQTVQE